MVSMDDAGIIDHILADEGGYTNDPADPGGPTNFGITMRELAEVRGHAVGVADVRALTRDEARTIYQQRYINATGYWRITDGWVRLGAVDAAVQHGPGRATLMLQALVGAKQDGVFGPVTAGLVNVREPAHLFLSLCAARVRYYGRIITSHPAEAVFAAGWANRVAALIEAAPLKGT